MSWAPASDAHGRAMAPVGFLLGVMLAELTLGPFIIVLTTGGLVMIRVLGVIVLLAALSVTGTPSAAVALLTAALVCISWRAYRSRSPRRWWRRRSASCSAAMSCGASSDVCCAIG